VVAAVALFALFGNHAAPSGRGALLPSATPSPSLAVDSPAPAVAATATPEPSVAPSATPTPVPTPSASPSGSPRLATCEGSTLAARITSWEGAAGSRIANVELTNVGSAACSTSEVSRTRLIDGSGRELIQGTQPTGGARITIPAGAAVTTLVEVTNYCGAPPVPPVGIAFDINGTATVVAKSASQTDATVPPCNGPGQPGSIQMQPWSAS
jgi:hypothetical protein